MKPRSHRPAWYQAALAAPIALTALLAIVTADRPAHAEEAPAADTRAVEVAHRMLDALGGQEAWDATRYVSFDFFGRRQHLWDKHTGRHRIEGTTEEGEPYVVIHDVADAGSAAGDGRVWLAGTELSGDARAEWLERAYGAWVNDTYWLVMPYKLLDPGVRLSHEGTDTVDGKKYDKVRLSFDGVGLTPGDRYWAWIDPETGLMDRWAYHLESMEPDASPTVWEWSGWKRYGDVRLADTRKRLTGDPVEVSMGPIEVMDEAPEGAFSGP